jgi:hypothetical protein
LKIHGLKIADCRLGYPKQSEVANRIPSIFILQSAIFNPQPGST